MTPALALARDTTSQSDWETNRMPASRLKFESLPHAIFLQRVSGPLGATSLEARLGQGAFLALRLVDLLAPDRLQVSGDAFHYQWIASAAGDRYSALRARIGLANTILGRGNLAEAERKLREILADARAAGEREAEARAEHGIGVALQHMGQSPDAIPHTWRAFQLYE